MARPRLLDLFCGAGGAAMGYHRAGFDVVGVDINPQPHYPFEFHQANAFQFMSDYIETGAFEYQVIHASPPCQAYSSLHGLTTKDFPKLIGPVREWLQLVGVPYVIENVVGSELISPIRLCGSSFGLGVWRHRLFEMSDPPAMVPPCSHRDHPKPLDVTGTGGPSSKPRTSSGGGLSRKPRNLAEAQAAMGIDWMTRRELSEAVPPVYTQWVGWHVLAALESAA